MDSGLSTDANKLESIQQKFAVLCFNHFFPEVHYCYSFDLEELKLHALRMRRNSLDAIFLLKFILFQILPVSFGNC
jgi:hypothetical protein